MDCGLKIATDGISEAAEELSDHLDLRGDNKGLEKLAALIDYVHMTVVLLNDMAREVRKEKV